MNLEYESSDYWSGKEALDRGGVAATPYRDFPINTIKVDYLLSKKPLGRVLDAGCAMGFIVRRLRQRGIEAWGLDISNYALSHAPEEVKPYLVRGTMTSLPFHDKYFDLIYSAGVMEHFSEEELPLVISELKRVSQRGLISITCKDSPGATEDPHHAALKSLEEWRALFPENFEVRKDDNEEWAKVKEIHIALLIAPVVFPCGGDMRYQGIERLVSYWARELLNRGVSVYVVAARGSSFPPGIVHIEVPQGDFSQGELVAYGSYRHFLLQGHQNALLRPIDLILDFSHSHQAMKEFPDFPAVCWVWHTPSLIQPPLPTYNVLALSQWQADQLFFYQRVIAKVCDPHCGFTLEEEPGEVFVFIGRATPSKGMLEAAKLCKEAGVKLNIIGGLGPGDDPGYLSQVQELCDYKEILYLGQVSDAVKNAVLSSARALLYPIAYAGNAGEAHSHKGVDSLLAGVPVIAYRQGALDEVVEHGIDGFLVNTRKEFLEAMLTVSSLDRDLIRKRAKERWSIPNTVEKALPLLTEVARGLKW